MEYLLFKQLEALKNIISITQFQESHWDDSNVKSNAKIKLSQKQLKNV